MPDTAPQLPPLTIAQRFRLLEIARDALTSQVRRSIRLVVTETEPRLLLKQGVFVTLMLGDRVRGCIGDVDGHGPLAFAVAEVVVSAAYDDPREAPLRLDEVSRVEIELSVLSRRTLTRWQDVEVGKHGVVLQRDRSVGVLLPQVASQFGWNREEFLEQAAVRAGLPAGSWKTPGTRLETFTAEVFAESSLRRGG